MVPTGLSYAVTMRVGLYYGAGNLLAARSAGRVGIGFGAMIMFAFAALFLLLPEALVGLFIDRNDIEKNPAIIQQRYEALSKRLHYKFEPSERYLRNTEKWREKVKSEK